MNGDAVLEFLKLAERTGLDICIDGGWAVDALLGYQSRAHSDIDIALPASDVPPLKELLDELGLRESPMEDSWEHNFVYCSKSKGWAVDVHSYVLDEQGNNVGGVPYEQKHLKGSGVIQGHIVKCVPAKWVVKFHTGYEVGQKDWHDVKLLCERFGLEIPAVFQRFM